MMKILSSTINRISQEYMKANSIPNLAQRRKWKLEKERQTFDKTEASFRHSLEVLQYEKPNLGCSIQQQKLEAWTRNLHVWRFGLVAVWGENTINKHTDFFISHFFLAYQHPLSPWLYIDTETREFIHWKVRSTGFLDWEIKMTQCFVMVKYSFIHIWHPIRPRQEAYLCPLPSYFIKSN